MRLTPILFSIALTLPTGVNANNTNNEVTSAISAAKAAKKEAAELGFEWRDMGKTIKKAEAAAKDGKDKKAIKLANRITKQLVSIRKQAAIAKKAGPRF